jgi:hypothetical protein
VAVPKGFGVETFGSRTGRAEAGRGGSRIGEGVFALDFRGDGVVDLLGEGVVDFLGEGSGDATGIEVDEADVDAGVGEGVDRDRGPFEGRAYMREAIGVPAGVVDPVSFEKFWPVMES